MSIVIIGAGFAGASCAWWLARLGAKDVTVIEREEMPGLHASGLNAGFARRFEEDEKVAPLASEGVDFITNPPRGFVDGPIIEHKGSLLLNAPKNIIGPHHKIISKKVASKMVPPLESAQFKETLWTPTDGIVDIHKYLWAFINGAKANGVRFLTSCNIVKFNVIARAPARSNPRREIASLTLAMTGKTFEINSNIIVNASGAWLQEIATLAGSEDLLIKPFRRHLFSTPPMKEADSNWPFVWDVKNQFYFRPESGGLLLGACDEDEVRPGAPLVDPKIKELLAEKLLKYCPAISNVSIAREWCGCRTFAPDKRPVIRFDKKTKNLFWLGALGGRGMTCASSAGRMAAEMIMKRTRSW